MNALKIIDQDHFDPRDMLGCGPGAMGKSQCMPSSFLLYAVSYDGDSGRDIWHSRPDVFASIANYLAQSGWHGDETWGRAVRLPAEFDPALVGLGVRKSLREWRQLGLRRSAGGALPPRDLAASVLRPGAHVGPALQVPHNFPVLLTPQPPRYFPTP